MYFQLTRSEISDILYSSDLAAEDKIIRAMEIRQETDSLIRVLRVSGNTHFKPVR